MKKTILLLFVLSFLYLSVWSQYTEETRKHEIGKHEIGMHAGSTTGIGLSYRFWPGKAGVQITAFPVKVDELTWISTGITGLVTFHESKYFRFFGYLGTHLIIHEDYTEEYFTGRRYYTSEQKFSFGFGPGFAFGSRARFNIMAGYGFYNIFGDYSILPAGEMGLYFRF